MKHIIFITTLFLFASCGQGSGTRTTKKSTNTDKNNYEQTDTNEQLATTTEVVADKDFTPVDIALIFINSYIDNCNKMKESIDIIEWVDSNTLTTKRFKTEVKTMVEEAFKIEPEIGLGFDPILDGNGYPDEGFELESFDSKTNFIVVKGKNWADFKLTIKVVVDNNKWLVDGCGIVNIPTEWQTK